jgi:nucleotide-binding universal stress UspA family protein
VLGSTAAALANHAHCPVAIIRNGDASTHDDAWIAVVVDHELDNDAVMQRAMEEARLRNAPVLALRVTRWKPGEVPYDQLERRLRGWIQRYPDVHVLPVDAGANAAHYLETRDEAPQLVVLGRADADHVTRLVGPHGHSILAHPHCSVLAVRQ